MGKVSFPKVGGYILTFDIRQKLNIVGVVA